MGDARLIREVAELWVDNGGDAEGVLCCVYQIIVEVEAVIKEREEEGV